jgi:ribosome-associated protein
VVLEGDQGKPAMSRAERPAALALADLERRVRGVASSVDLGPIRERALLAAKAALDLKAEEVRILDMHELVTYTDFLVLCTGRNARLTRRIAETVASKLKTEAGVAPVGTEGTAGGEWILLDFLDFIVHVFTPKAREFYRLDVLWKQAPAEEVS